MENSLNLLYYKLNLYIYYHLFNRPLYNFKSKTVDLIDKSFNIKIT